MASNTRAIVTAILLAAVIAVGGGLSFLPADTVVAQVADNMTGGVMRSDGMMGMGPGMGNQSAMMQMMGASQNITGSINLFSTIGNAIESQVKTSLSEAASIAEGTIGNNSHAVVAHIGKTNGYLTYCVLVLGPDTSLNMVIVDPGNGEVLSKSQIPLQHLMMSMGSGMMGPGMMGMGPGMMNHDMGMMGMGPGMMNHDMGMMGMGPGMMNHDLGMMGMGPGMMR
jgi:hypothetical protein